MSDLGLHAKLTSDSSQFTGGLKQAQNAMGALKSATSALAVPLGVLGMSFAAFKSVTGIMDGLKASMELGKELKTQSAITGQSVRDIVILKKAYSESGLEAGSLTQTLSMLQASLGGVSEEGQSTKYIFEQLGLSIDNLKGQSSVVQLDSIGKAISRLGSQESKMAATRAIFGRSGAQMLALFNNPNAIEESTKRTATVADLYQRNAAIFARVTNSLEAVGGKVKGMFAGLAETAAPALESVLKKLQAINTVKIGQELGKGIKDAIDLMLVAFETGNLGELVGLSLEIGIFKVLPKIEAAMLAAFMAPVAAVTAGMETAMHMMDPTASGGWIDKIHRAFLHFTKQNLEDTYANAARGADKTAAWADLKEFRRDSAGVYAQLNGGQTKAPTYNETFVADLKQQRDDAKWMLDGQGSAPEEDVKRHNELLTQLKSKPQYKALAAGSVTEPEPGKGAGGSLTTGLGNVKSQSSDGDKLAKIGLFVGAGSAAMQYARETARNTADILKALNPQTEMQASASQASKYLPYAT